jgi:hypothetical protein
MARIVLTNRSHKQQKFLDERAKLNRYYNYRNYDVLFGASDFVAVHGREPDDDEVGTWVIQLKSKRARHLRVTLRDVTFLYARHVITEKLLNAAVTVGEAELNEFDGFKYPWRLKAFLVSGDLAEEGKRV